MSLRRRLRSLFHRNEADGELDEELKFHVEQKMLDLIARGMDPLTARTAALRSFGGVEKMKEECRDMRGAHWLENFRHD
ncbi:MAG TPA: permease prefix domain 1-containing protein, partial [Candidatus Acidoferrales bacterium]|nr:permease prefix domain 1-containing protein [Candidatus Acidoferrales bacterium]